MSWKKEEAGGARKDGVITARGRGRGDGESGALAEKLMVDGWWLLVNEREGFRDGERCALRAHGGDGGFITTRGRWRSHRENVALADNLRLMVRKLQAQRLAKMRSLRSRDLNPPPCVPTPPRGVGMTGLF